MDHECRDGTAADAIEARRCARVQTACERGDGDPALGNRRAEESATSGKPFVILDLNGLSPAEVDWDGMARLQNRVRLYLLASQPLSAPGYLPEAPRSEHMDEIETWIISELKHFDFGRPVLIPDEMRARQSDPSCWFTLESFMAKLELLAEKHRYG